MALLFSLSFFVGSLTLHLVLWRLARPMRDLKALWQIFLLGYLIGIVTSFILEIGAMRQIYFTLFFGIYSAIYLLTYTGLQGFGPTFTILLLVRDSEGRGVTLDEIGKKITNKSFVDFRLNELIAMGWIEREKNAESFFLTNRGRSRLLLFTFYRRWLGLKEIQG